MTRTIPVTATNAPRRSSGCRARWSGSALVLVALAAAAAPPPGHPSAEQAGRLLDLPASQPYQGKVLRALAANAFTYIEVEQVTAAGSGSRWIVAPRIDVQPGARIRFGNGRVMAPFASRKLGISFESVTFVGPISIE